MSPMQLQEILRFADENVFAKAATKKPGFS